jgi:hypothetical protein
MRSRSRCAIWRSTSPTFDIRPSLTRGDSLYRRSMSRTGKNIQSGVYITIMYSTASTAYPLPYSKVCDTFRPRIGHSATTRTDLGGEAFFDFFIPRAMLNSLVRQLTTEDRPRRIEYGLGHLGLGKSCGIHIPHRNKIELSHDAMRELMQLIVTSIGNLGVYLRSKPLFVCSLRHAKTLFQSLIVVSVGDFFARRKSGKVFQAEINTHCRVYWTYWNFSDIYHDIQIPVAASIAAEVRTVPDFPFREISGIEYAKSVASEAKSAPLALEVSAFERNPCKALFATVAKVGSLVPLSRVGVLLAYRVHCTRVQTKQPSASRREHVQVEAARPFFVPLQCVLLRVVAVIPHKVYRAALSVQQAVQRLHAIAVDQIHSQILTNPARFLPALNGSVSTRIF